jgi:hypothetical protein
MGGAMVGLEALVGNTKRTARSTICSIIKMIESLTTLHRLREISDPWEVGSRPQTQIDITIIITV